MEWPFPIMNICKDTNDVNDSLNKCYKIVQHAEFCTSILNTINAYIRFHHCKDEYYDINWNIIIGNIVPINIMIIHRLLWEMSDFTLYI